MLALVQFQKCNYVALNVSAIYHYLSTVQIILVHSHLSIDFSAHCQEPTLNTPKLEVNRATSKHLTGF